MCESDYTALLKMGKIWTCIPMGGNSMSKREEAKKCGVLGLIIISSIWKRIMGNKIGEIKLE